MEKEKGGIIAIIIPILFALLILGGAGYFAYRYDFSLKENNNNTDNSQQLIGGDTDEHGCLIAAGYSWCEAKQKCLRAWEEPCQ